MDVSQSHNFNLSLLRQLIMTVLGIGFFGISYWLIAFDQGRREALTVAIGWFCILFFGFALIVGWAIFLRSPRPTLRIAPSGITDVRMTEDQIPWSGIVSIQLGKVASNKFLMLQLKPEVESGLSLTRLAKRTRGPNRAFGFDGLYIDTMNLAARHETIAELIGTYAAIHGDSIELDL